MRSLIHKLGFIGTLAMVLAVLAIVFVLAAGASACPQQLNAGCAQQVYAQPLAVQQFAVAPQVQYFQQQAVQAYVAPQPVVVQRQVAAYSQPVLVQRAYAQPLAVQQVAVQAVAVDKQRARFALRPRLQRAANIGASSATGLPVGAIRVVR